MALAKENVDRWSWVVVLLALLANFLFSGIIFGWASLQLLFEEDGVYRGLCPAGTSPRCASRIARLVLLYTLGSTANVLGGTPSGFLVDWAGPRVCNVLCGTAVSCSLLLMGISQEGGIDAFGVGSVLMGFGGALVLMTSIPVAFVVPEARRPLVLTSINCLFDASSVVFLLVYQLFARAGLSRRVILVGYAALCAVLHLALVVAWSRGPLVRLQAAKAAEELNMEAPPPPAESAANGGEDRTSAEAAATMEGRAVAGGPSERIGVEAQEVSVEVVPAGSDDGSAKRPRLHGLGLRRQVQTFEFAFAMLFLSLQLFRSNTYLGTNKELLEKLGDAETGYVYTQIFAALLPASTVCLPVITWCLSQRGFFVTFLIVVAFGVAWNAVALISSLPLQVLSFAAFTNFRAFIYSAYFTYIAHSFGSRTSGSVHGLITILAAALNFLIWPLVLLAETDPERGFVFLYAALLVLCAPLLLLVMRLRVRLRANPEADCRVAPASSK